MHAEVAKETTSDVNDKFPTGGTREETPLLEKTREEQLRRKRFDLTEELEYLQSMETIHKSITNMWIKAS
jgi:hypothetical protein